MYRPVLDVQARALLLKMWSTDRQHRNHLRANEKHRIPSPTSDGPSQNLHCNKSPGEFKHMVYFDACWSRQPENWLPAAPPGFHSLLLIKQLPFPRNWDSLLVRLQDPGCSHYGGGFSAAPPRPWLARSPVPWRVPSQGDSSLPPPGAAGTAQNGNI